MGLGGLLCFLLLAVSHPGTAQGEVVKDFKECDSFFKDHIPPQGFDGMNNLVRICQRYHNRYHFATLYRTDLRIPVYSAYTYQAPSNVKEGVRPSPWFYEPQIDKQSADANMESSKGKTSDKQAVDSDYANTDGKSSNKQAATERYQRGHLFPFDFSKGDSATASCTLTNAIPQTGDANKKWYHYAERHIKNLAETCYNSGSQAYVVTGSAEYTELKMKNRVEVPGLIWTALCCSSSVGQKNPSSSTMTDFSIAFRQELEKTNLVTTDDVTIMTVPELERRLNLGSVRIFNQCKGTNGDEEQQTHREVIAFLKIETPKNNQNLKRKAATDKTSLNKKPNPKQKAGMNSNVQIRTGQVG